MKYAYLFFTLIIYSNLYSQSPLQKEWDYRFGGSDDELFHSFEQTSDGGYILGGYTGSPLSGDVSQPNHFLSGFDDYWIVKTDSLGVKQWDKRFGGDFGDAMWSVHQTADGGYILGGSTNSDTSFDSDISQPIIGYTDWWIVKTDAQGTMQWEKRLGGLDADYLYEIQQTPDGGYIIGGTTNSDSSGDVSQHTRGLADYWLMKIDPVGNKIWDKRFGGSQNDNMYMLRQTTDGGYILGGVSRSDSTGDFSHHSRGIDDYWIVKTDALGNKQWDNRFGGTALDYLFDLKQTYDGGYILGGYTSSGMNGDISQPTRGMSDYWIVKTDANGNKIWDKRYGGNDDEALYKIEITNDKGFLLSGSSFSNISGEKSENNLSNEQMWIVKTDSSGNKIWDKTIMTISFFSDDAGYAFQNSEGCYLIANFTEAGVGGDKTQPSQGGSDFWVLKYCDTTTVSSIMETNSENSLSVYPNPFTDKININDTKQGDEIILYDITGKEVLRQQCLNNVTEIIIHDLSKGFYILHYEATDKSSNIKIFKN
jgi:type IX secretion system substrate protein